MVCFFLTEMRNHTCVKQMNSAITNELAPEVNNGLLRIHIVYNIGSLQPVVWSAEVLMVYLNFMLLDAIKNHEYSKGLITENYVISADRLFRYYEICINTDLY